MALSLVAGHALAAIFFQVQPWGPPVLSVSAAILTGATMLACFIATQRATGVSRLAALRTE